MGLFGKKQPEWKHPKQDSKPYYIPPHDCTDPANILLSQEGKYLVHMCGRCDTVVKREYNVPPPTHG